MKHTCRCTCTAYGGRCDCHFDGRTQGYAAALADVDAWLRARDWSLSHVALAIERGEVPRGNTRDSGGT